MSIKRTLSFSLLSSQKLLHTFWRSYSREMRSGGGPESRNTLTWECHMRALQGLRYARVRTTVTA